MEGRKEDSVGEGDGGRSAPLSSAVGTSNSLAVERRPKGLSTDDFDTRRTWARLRSVVPRSTDADPRRGRRMGSHRLTSRGRIGVMFSSTWSSSSVEDESEHEEKGEVDVDEESEGQDGAEVEREWWK